LEVTTCFAPLVRWIVSHWPDAEHRLALAMDATTLADRFVVLALSVVYRGCAIPVAWVVLPATVPGAWKAHWLALFQQVQGTIPADWLVLVLADRGLYAAWLFQAIQQMGWHPYLRINAGGKYRPEGASTFRFLMCAVPQDGTVWCGRVVCFKSNPLACTLLARHDKQHTDPWLILTDLAPEQAEICLPGG
jgi:hypothetical protein